MQQHGINTENKTEKIFILLDIDIQHVCSVTECVQWKFRRLIGIEITVKESVNFFLQNSFSPFFKQLNLMYRRFMMMSFS